jgi:hypothetical protein
MRTTFGTLANIIFLLALFPYVSPLDTPFDTQPWAFLAAFVFVMALLLKRGFSFPCPLFLLMVVTIYAGLIYLLYLAVGESDLLGGLRSFVGYLTLFLLTFVGYKTFRYVRMKIYIAAVIIWFLVGFVQLTYNLRFGEWILPRFSTYHVLLYRGVPSLAPEPAYYATVCAALIVFNEIFYRERKYRTWLYLAVLIMLMFQLIISYSGVGLLILLLFAFAKSLSFLVGGDSIKQKMLSFFVISSIIFVVYLFTLHPALQRSRAGDLLNQLMMNPMSLLRDPSVSTRVGNIVLVLYGGLLRTYGLGFGLARTGQERIPEWLIALLGIERFWGGRTMGGLLSAIYELGMIGLIMIIAVWWIIVRSILNNRRMRPVLLLSVFVFLLPRHIFDSIAFPLLGYLLGVHLFYTYEKGGNHVVRH